jgi:hypothetical protein
MQDSSKPTVWDGDSNSCIFLCVSMYFVLSPPCGMETSVKYHLLQFHRVGWRLQGKPYVAFSVLSPPCGMET